MPMNIVVYYFRQDPGWDHNKRTVHEQIKEDKLNVAAWRERKKVKKEQDANLLFDGRTDHKIGQQARLLRVNMIELFPGKGLIILPTLAKHYLSGGEWSPIEPV